MEYATACDVGAKRRGEGINEDSTAVLAFEDVHRDGYRGQSRALTGWGGGEDGGESGDRNGNGSGNGDSPGLPAPRGVAAFALADGAGGHEAGDAASYLASTVVCEKLAEVAVGLAAGDPSAFGLDVPGSRDTPSAADLQAAVASAVEAAHRRVLAYASEAGRPSYTTVVAGIAGGGRLHYGWVGDSRAYLVNGRAETIERLTVDHSVVADLLDAGEVDEYEAAVHPKGNEITRALGGRPGTDPGTATVEVETRTVELYAEDVVLATSDGLPDAQTDAPDLYRRYVESGRSEDVRERITAAVVTDDEVRDAVLDADGLKAAAADLVALANDRGGKDNLSVVLCRDRTLPETPPAERRPTRAVDPDEPVEDRRTDIIPDG